MVGGESLASWLPAVHAAATWFMVGLIWLVQVVHYPGFAAVGPEAFVAYHRQHVDRTGRVVALPMLVEMACALALWQVSRGTPAAGLATAGLGLAVLIWVSTATLQVPCHRALTNGWNDGAGRRLVVTNWLRTGAWTARGVLALLLLRAGG